MDLNRVAAFARVVHSGSFTAAAKALGVPKSSVSRSVAQLEEDLGTRLLHRTTRKLHLTEAGASFYERVARALVEIDEATAAAADTQEQPRGTVRVSAPLDVGVWALASTLGRFATSYPTIHVDVSLSGRVVDLVSEGFDLAVRIGELRDQSLIARRTGIISGGIFASSRYVEKAGAPRTIADLLAHSCVLFRPVNGKATWKISNQDGHVESVTVRGSLGVDDVSFVKKAVLAGAGVGLLPHFLCAREVASGKLIRVLPEWVLATREIHVVYPSARFLPHRVALVRDALVSGLGEVLTRCAEVAPDPVMALGPPARRTTTTPARRGPRPSDRD